MGMMKFSKGSLLVALGAILGASLPACGTIRLNIKTWFLDEEQGGLIRKHDNAPTEVLPFPEAKGYRCVNKADFDLLINLAKQSGIRGIH